MDHPGDSAEGRNDLQEPASGRPYAELYDMIAAAFRAHDKATAVRTAVEAVTSGYITIPALYRDVLTPLLVSAGAGWQRGTVAVWEEHLASASVRTVVEILYPGVLKAKATAAQTGRSVLLACPPEEAHDLGLRMVADRFDMAGWTTYFLGADTPVEEIADAALRLGVDAVVMSSSTHWHRVAVRHAVDYLRKSLPSVDVWVGGPAFAGAAGGWLPQEIVDLDELLGDATGPGRAGATDEAEGGGGAGVTGEVPADVLESPGPAESPGTPATAATPGPESTHRPSDAAATSEAAAGEEAPDTPGPPVGEPAPES